ncbi:allophanate hydrolase subunit 1 [Gracilibacillus halophilus YIM-C55.5]|uniref:Allophanate hydrolase subunit 1 n=1 Tax=Gracilibacillus halophilus YIM-C55.5 TaxID=1308866 RepID=N4WDM5_9BACI|nr:5-oxoprolinase subunit PxpB [Gracilibacillus halophilus]ENH98373.1 allophanate hydrolase subunit 1 [Gracilibacillus halophilus YIM-C55.5]
MQTRYVTENAVMFTVADELSQQAQETLLQLHHQLAEEKPDWLVESVIGYTTLTVYFYPLRIVHDQVANYIQSFNIQSNRTNNQHTLHRIPVCYHPSVALDIDEVARKHQLSMEQVIARHTSVTYTVSFLGFSPGFPFLSGLSDELATPRKETPRREVPKGSVGIAGQQTGIYPSTSPGGWQIIGRIPISLLHFHRLQPTLFQPGDQVQFYPISKQTYESYRRKEKHS